MIEKSKKNKKGVISEEDVSTLLQRYTATTLLALLQEVAQFDEAKIDWNALVKKTSTGISNAREYQMLWRHLAYRHVLPEKFDDGAYPLDDDDSDLESELEAYPSVTSEASTEAAACVKVLIASGLPSDSTHPNNTTVEAPLTINIPNGRSLRATSENSQSDVMRGVNIRVPVSVQKLSLPAVTSCPASEVYDANGSGSGIFPPRRKRKPWSEAEDMELIAAVQKLGEGNWASIVRGEFKGDRTASQLSQRWAIIRKRHGNLNVGTVSIAPQLSETQRAARDAVKMALDPHPAAKSLIASSAGTKTPNNCVPPTFTAEASPAQHQSQQRTMMTKSSSIWPVGPAAKSQVMLAKASEKSILSSDPVRAAAVAAGARIATQSDAASLLKAAQAKNAVHIMPTGSSSIKSSMTGGISTHLDVNPNTRFISSGMATAPTTTRPAASGPFPGLPKATSPPPQMKASSSTVQHTQSTPVTSFNAQSEQTNSGLAKATVLPPQMKASSLTTQNTQSTPIMSLSTPSEQTIAESSPKQGIVTIKDTQAFGSQEVANSQVLKDGAHVSVKEPSEHFQEVKAALTNQEAELKSQVAVLEISNGSPKLIMNESGLVNVTGNQVNGSQNADDNKMTCSPIKEAENQSAVQENDQNQSVSERQADLPSSASNESCIKVDSISITEASDGMMDG
ncbi:mucin-5AC-like isoform X2 [Populus alba x Populus x berolinensis]|uniref:Mucin-5AC-like isoform X2 n=1 Tax=Populus alba x Populus x berolinensis TaxID=444605 RepID=A0AAD6REY4_9ROSI|nr:mucin-5AC-like isoform X2 [Populus alba x Populus x berolinensis]